MSSFSFANPGFVASLVVGLDPATVALQARCAEAGGILSNPQTHSTLMKYLRGKGWLPNVARLLHPDWGYTTNAGSITRAFSLTANGDAIRNTNSGYASVDTGDGGKSIYFNPNFITTLPAAFVGPSLQLFRFMTPTTGNYYNTSYAGPLVAGTTDFQQFYRHNEFSAYASENDGTTVPAGEYHDYVVKRQASGDEITAAGVTYTAALATSSMQQLEMYQTGYGSALRFDLTLAGMSTLPKPAEITELLTLLKA